MAGVGQEEFDEREVWDVLLQDPANPEASTALTTTPPRNRRGKGKAVPACKDDGLGAGATARSKGRPPSAPVAIPGGCLTQRAAAGDEDEEEDEDGGEMLPPHEWLARKMQRMGVATPPEVCRGRSKGREMRKVRDAVLPKTAFSEQ